MLCSIAFTSPLEATSATAGWRKRSFDSQRSSLASTRRSRLPLRTATHHAVDDAIYLADIDCDIVWTSPVDPLIREGDPSKCTVKEGEDRSSGLARL